MSKEVSERDIREQHVRDETLQQVNRPLHAAYIAGVLSGGFLLMILIMVFLHGGAGG